MKEKRLAAGLTVALIVLSAAAQAQTAAPPAEPPAAATLASLENTAAFIGEAFAEIHFLNESSRMATAHATSEKLRNLAARVAKEQTSAGFSVMHWVHVSGDPQSGSSSLVARFNTPRMTPDKAAVLQRLSRLQGREFDVLYISEAKDALGRLQSACENFIRDSGDAALQTIAARELPEAKKFIAALDEF